MSLVLLPLFAMLTSLLAALFIFLLPEAAHRARISVNLLAAVLKLSLVMAMALGVFRGVQYHLAFPLLPGLDFVLRVDALSLLFAGLSSVLWLCTTVYAIGYLEYSPNRSRFFGFFSLCETEE